MRKSSSFLLIVFVLLLNACNNKENKAKVSDSSTIESPYLGQKPPGLTPKLFAPDIIQTEHQPK